MPYSERMVRESRSDSLKSAPIPECVMISSYTACLFSTHKMSQQFHSILTQ